MIHLVSNTDDGDVCVWCEASGEGKVTEDPYDADCADCLREAATYGAKAAMRCAAVEAGAERDPEIAKERDEAIAALDKLCGVLGENELFVCAGCQKMYHVQGMGFHAGLMAWCSDCSCSCSRGRIL